MRPGFDVKEELMRYREKTRTQEDLLLEEVHSILNGQSIDEQHILHNLKHYNKVFDLLDESEVDPAWLFTEKEIKAQCIRFRLRFLDSQHYRPDIPSEAVVRIKYLNDTLHKELQHFKILAPAEGFRNGDKTCNCVLFAPTRQGRYYLVHSWGRRLKWHQKLLSFPMRNFETLLLTVFTITLITTLSLPTYLITLDREATYWCGYRIATFFHLFIFYSGVTAYLLVGFNKNFSGAVWKTEKEYD